MVARSMMISTRRCAAALLVCGIAEAAHADEARAVIAVFDVEVRGARVSTEARTRLTDYVASLLAAQRFQVVPRSEVLSRLAAKKKESFRACYDEACQLEVGKELAAQKTVSTQVLELGGRCKATVTLYDLARAASERAGTASSGCAEAEIVVAVEQATRAMLGLAADPGPSTAAVTLDPGVLSAVPSGFSASGSVVLTELDADLLVLYERALAADAKGEAEPKAAVDAWRAVTKVRRKNPFAADAKKRLDAWAAYAKRKETFTRQYADDRAKLDKVLGLRVVPLAEKKKVVASFVGRYAATFGLAGALAVLPRLGAEDAANVEAEVLTDELLGQLCARKDAAACERAAARAAAAERAARERELVEGGASIVRFPTRALRDAVCGQEKPSLAIAPAYVARFAGCLDDALILRRTPGMASTPATVHLGTSIPIPVAVGRQCARGPRDVTTGPHDFRPEWVESGGADGYTITAPDVAEAYARGQRTIAQEAERRCREETGRAATFWSNQGFDVSEPVPTALSVDVHSCESIRDEQDRPAVWCTVKLVGNCVFTIRDSVLDAPCTDVRP
ncbi:hypothetical protein L6R52_40060 [Myxococcota bacterium]|nr:hypothetical protein [Myxococcota bacterium]